MTKVRVIIAGYSNDKLLKSLPDYVEKTSSARLEIDILNH